MTRVNNYILQHTETKQYLNNTANGWTNNINESFIFHVHGIAEITKNMHDKTEVKQVELEVKLI
jgi:hypothetical protein